MEFYLEPARNIPVLTTTEVLVVGGGPSGIAAAMSAAREGAATMLIERFGCFWRNDDNGWRRVNCLVAS